MHMISVLKALTSPVQKWPVYTCLTLNFPKNFEYIIFFFSHNIYSLGHTFGNSNNLMAVGGREVQREAKGNDSGFGWFYMVLFLWNRKVWIEIGNTLKKESIILELYLNMRKEAGR